jgi:hypothetical protein
MKGRSQMQLGKNWILWKQIMQTVLLRLSLSENLEKPLMSLYAKLLDEETKQLDEYECEF